MENGLTEWDFINEKMVKATMPPFVPWLKATYPDLDYTEYLKSKRDHNYKLAMMDIVEFSGKQGGFIDWLSQEGKKLWKER